jgi:hypothetical protein
MHMNTCQKRLLRYCSLFAILVNTAMAFAQPPWPVITKECKPGARWWWPGSIVTATDLTAAMEKYNKAGLGGLELTVIYGVRGQEDKFIPYLSPKWMEMFVHTLKEGKWLDMNIDLSNASSWPFGGAWVDTTDASKTVVYKTYTVKGGESLSESVGFRQQPLVRVNNYQKEIPKLSELVDPIGKSKNLQEYAIDQVKFEKQLPLQTLIAYSDAGQAIDITNLLDVSGKLNWIAPAGNWTLYAVFQGWHGKMVERAGPGGEGYVIDHFSDQAIQNFLKHFDESFKGFDVSALRGYFNDSYEVDDAVGQGDWTPKMFDEFKSHRGYDLKDNLPALFQKDPNTDKNVRVLCDFRQTISDLLLERYTTGWTNWAHQQGKITRNQAHGSPASILDLYAATDIPETEGNDILRMKFGTSAAHVSNKNLASAEVATWLGEHFSSTLNDAKKAVDLDLLAGVNHIFYHGTCFSPQNEPWPGFLFYASAEFTPVNSFWNDFSILNNYIGHVQSFMQSGKPNNDVLLYFPIFDSYSGSPQNMLEHFDRLTGPLATSVFKGCADTMLQKGYAFDYISDRQLQQVNNDGNRIQTGGATYQTIVIPACQYIPLETFQKALALAQNGATVIVCDKLPGDVSGWNNLEARRKKFNQLKSSLRFTDVQGILEAKTGKGVVLSGNKLEQLLAYAKIRRETMVDNRLQFCRRKTDRSTVYFVHNTSDKAFEGWISLAADNAQAAVVYNPMTEKTGIAKIRTSATGTLDVYAQLAPGESYIIKTSNTSTKGKFYGYYKVSGHASELTGKWSVSFVEGGPTLPAATEITKLVSWTDFGGEDVKNFSGTARYTLSFAKPTEKAEAWLLDLGKVCESARVTLNGKKIAGLIGPTFEVLIDSKQLKANNRLEIKVSNLMANRIADLDRRGVNWKKFYNSNFPARLGANRNAEGLFDASKWLPRESGLVGPVTITPAQYITKE